MMNKETLATMTIEQVMRQLQEVKERRRAAITRANDAIKAYEKAVEARDAKIKELREDLHKQLTGIEDRATALNGAMLKASISGNDAKVDEAQRALTDLEGQRSRLNARLESPAGKPPRCDDAYEAMEAAVAESRDADGQYESDARIIREFCEEVVKSWEEILSSLRNRGADVSQFFLDRARSHYSSEHHR